MLDIIIFFIVSVLKGETACSLGALLHLWVHVWEEVNNNSRKMTHKGMMGRDFISRDTI